MTPRPSLITKDDTLRRRSAAEPQGATQTMGQSLANAPLRQTQGRVGEVSWSTQILRYLQGNPGLVQV
jgi:hypothetical protein